MKVSDLVRFIRQDEGFESHSREWLGLVMEAEDDDDEASNDYGAGASWAPVHRAFHGLPKYQ